MVRKTRTLLLSGAITFVLLCGCVKNQTSPKEDDLARIKAHSQTGAKKVILVLVDSLMAHAIDKGIRQNQLPAFQYLAEHGQFYKNIVTSFPTMSVSIDSTLLTGTYPNKHRVPALVWYSSKDKRIVNYGSGPMEISRLGPNHFLTDSLIKLNGDHLNPQTPTLFEELAKKGLKSGSINGLVYRGSSIHSLSIPQWLQVPSALPKEIKVKGPDFFAFGALSNPLESKKDMPANITEQFGLNNEFSLEAVKYLIENNKLPDFLFVYFPELDRKIHKNGPSDLDGVIRTDKQLQSLLDAFGSREEALKKAVIMVLGDNGMAPVLPANRQPVIDLGPSLKEYDVLRQGSPVTDQTEVIVAVNDRMAYVYKAKPTTSFERIANALKTDPRFDILAWADKGWIRVARGGSSKEFAYRSGGKLVDPYQQSWTLAKDPEVLDLQINREKQTLDYGQYPDALQRLYSALNSHDGEFMVVTAKPGYELKYGSSPTHERGAGHGGISQTESLVPLMITGTERKPESLRIVDLKSYILGFFKQYALNNS